MNLFFFRFVFHDYNSTKLENKVIFPKNDLDLTDYQCGPIEKPMQYDLVGCVCHTGGYNLLKLKGNLLNYLFCRS